MSQENVETLNREMLRDLYEAFAEFRVEYSEVRHLGDRLVAVGRWMLVAR